ncbi:bacillithiol biosynthesis cysteine-adding enzyme BshC [Arachidicoccus ginsenosidimutans]|uniref:bacillithiol biosynthesis cysteine-adding enzyme BshC n=1 Tax=Arachidicoccus sp. BS20 TaxID=1850526 RepID=UPI0007F0DD45|nr:bacillithiol biosynthesis cysteine-adding enzyme BshC [Arachidicoccus sp. BS20]ANI90159.1 bacillithiol biosynthesis cysteine-adding enzyme BshC [Arachidicoccus sp. BS20]
MSEGNCTFIDYKNTGYFSKIAVDYIEQKEDLQPFFLHEVSYKGIEDSVKARENFPQHNRNILVEELQHQYAEIQTSSTVQQNIISLKNQNTFTVTTAHQPNIFGGPLYVVYKILHVVKIAQELSTKYSDKYFVPVYYMGSEDADLDELNNITINGKKYVWHTTQTGAVGRMCIDKNLLSLIDEMQAQIGVESFGNEWIDILKSAYKQGKNIQQATFEFLNAAFGKYGLLIIIPDNANLKRLFEPIIVKELKQQFSHKALQQTVSALTEKNYHAQTEGRELNLFYLLNDKRERIEIENGLYVVRNLNLQFSQEEIINEVKNYPDRFSANVVLRGVFQETILPNIAFVGGGGELAYWLELKNVFANANVPYPMLLLRNSFLFINERQKEIIQKLHISFEILFKKEHEILNEILAAEHREISLDKELDEIKSTYQSLKNKANKADTTLMQHVEALFIKAFKRIENLEKKISSAQRKKLTTEKSQIEKLKSDLFPKNSLQERVENIAGFYATYGSKIFDTILENSLTIESKFGIIFIQ